MILYLRLFSKTIIEKFEKNKINSKYILIILLFNGISLDFMRIKDIFCHIYWFISKILWMMYGNFLDV